ncbi:hypothetical protein B0H34DRAFT_856335 [Crassisporium funariophilum]|nr:hypothetical protein B0H34DRAFT_856335 [Crassisporium funariophilum]
MKAHIQETHKTAPILKYEHLWKLSNFEAAEMKKIWAKRKNIVVKRTRKSKNPPLVVSENHCAHIPASHVELSSLDSNKEALSNDLADEEGAAMEEDTGEEQEGFFESTFKNPMLNAKALLQMNEDVDMMPVEATAPVSASTDELISNSREHEESNDNLDMIDTAPTSRATSFQAVTETQQTGPANEDVIETSGRGRRKRAPRWIGDLNSCLCGMAVNLGVDSNRAIECRQPGCKTRWYHLECIALKQAPTKWICKACEASGPARAKRLRK